MAAIAERSESGGSPTARLRSGLEGVDSCDGARGQWVAIGLQSGWAMAMKAQEGRGLSQKGRAPRSAFFLSFQYLGWKALIVAMERVVNNTRDARKGNILGGSCEGWGLVLQITIV